jgi:zinc and cadmium transporter
MLSRLRYHRSELRFDVAGLVLFGAGNFVYIAASDLIPEIKAEAGPARAALATATFGLGLTLMYLLAVAFA